MFVIFCLEPCILQSRLLLTTTDVNVAINHTDIMNLLKGFWADHI